MDVQEQFIQIIESICSKIIKNATKDTPKTWTGKIITASVAPNGNASLYVNGDTTSAITLKNKTWETIVANNECIIFSPSGSLSNAVILYKK